MRQLSGQNNLDAVADPDTLAYYAEKLNMSDMEKLLDGLYANQIFA